VVKRVLDITASAIALALFCPLLVLAAIAVWLRLGSPVLFRQIRPGLNGKPFQIIKFRTMTDARDSTGRMLSDAERLTALGKFLRATSLDELPTLLNVFKGDMSLVGPRPLLMEYLERYSPEQKRRHDVKPGVTGWAQVNGRNALSWEKKFECDVWYVRNQSLLLDLGIMFLTVKKILVREGISQPGQATMEEFMGTKERANVVMESVP
jgi:sugar transferase EpsL